MKTSSMNVLGMLAAALVAGGLLSACPTTKVSDAGSTSSGSGSGSSSGSICGAAASACTVSSECCTGLTCSGGSCTAPCGTAGSTCSASSLCCSPLACDKTSNTCLPPTGVPDGGDGGCILSPAFGPCVTAADCNAPNVCQPAADGGGFCGPVQVAPSAICIPNGQACTAGSTEPCCGGSCVNSLCVPRTACGVTGQGCNVTGDCCNNFKCVMGLTGHDSQSDGGLSDGGSSSDAGTVDTDGGTTTSDGGTVDTDGGATTSDGGTVDTDGGATTSDAGTPTPDAGGPTFAGSCQPACAAYFGACDQANGNADCCQIEGLSCLTNAQIGLPAGSSPTAGYCLYAQFADSAGNPVYCGNSCSNFPCVLGASCQIPTTGALAGVDPCGSAGLLCDQQFSVCRNPSEGESCLPGGPSCQPFANTTVTDIQCLPTPSKFGGGNYSCFQPCALADPGHGTNDCVDGLMTCTAIGGTGTGAECFFNEASACAIPFGPCNSAGVGDGVCVPYNFSNGSAGLCFQATLDGGAPGSACSYSNNGSANRQNGGFCDPTSWCLYGSCEAACNVGTKGTPACGQNDAGPAVGCQPIFGQSGDANDFGSCSPDCDFASLTGGGCATGGEVPEKCLPPAYFGLTDAPTGICVGAPAPAEAIAVGQPCPSSPSVVDTCVDGALCLGSLGTQSTCVQLCTNVGGPGAPCNADQVCTGINFTGTPAAHEGYCSLPDGGLGG